MLFKKELYGGIIGRGQKPSANFLRENKSVTKFISLRPSQISRKA